MLVSQGFQLGTADLFPKRPAVYVAFIGHGSAYLHQNLQHGIRKQKYILRPWRIFPASYCQKGLSIHTMIQITVRRPGLPRSQIFGEDMGDRFLRIDGISMAIQKKNRRAQAGKHLANLLYKPLFKQHLAAPFTIIWRKYQLLFYHSLSRLKSAKSQKIVNIS
jgi:hypothetical protein